MQYPDPEVPEADAAEQARPLVPGPGEPDPALKPKMTFEVPEADALDQAREVPVEDDEWR